VAETTTPVIDHIRLRRRTSGASGPPSSLYNAEPAYSEIDDILYIGVGVGPDGKAATIRPIAGSGAYATKEYVTSAIESIDVTPLLSNYLTTASAATTYLSITTAASIYLTQGAADVVYAPIDSAALIGIPTAPTAANGDDSTQIANTEYVQTAVSDIIDGAPVTLDTLKKIADAIGSDPNFYQTVVNALASKLNRTSNLSDLSDSAAARNNLGLGTMAQQNANNVSITGGSIDETVIDGGSF